MEKFTCWFMGAVVAVLIILVFIDSNKTELAATETHVISGVVVDVDFIAKTSSFNAADIKKTIVKFDDGRVATFNGISNQVLQKGRMNEISFSNRYGISSVRIN